MTPSGQEGDRGSLRSRWERDAGQWVDWARTPGRDHYFHEFNLPAFLPLLPAPPAQCLDLGAGEGRVGRVLVEAGFSVIGIDGSAALARAAAAPPGAPGTGVVGDAAALPFAGGRFDLTVAFMSLQDIDDQAYVDALGRANLALERLIEPRPSAAYLAAHPEAQALDSAPLYLHFTARRAG